MTKDYHYLPVRINSLLWRYGSVYLPLIILFVLSNWSLLSIAKFTILFLIICVPILLSEYLGAYFLMKDNFLIQRLLFGSERKIPIGNITKIVKSRFGLAHAESLECYYKKGEAEKNILVTLFNREPKEVVKFLSDIRDINPNIIIDPELKKSLEKKLDKTRNWKDKIFD